MSRARPTIGSDRGKHDLTLLVRPHVFSALYLSGFWHGLRHGAVGQNASNQLRVAILFIADDLAVLEVNHEDVVIVVVLAIAREILAPGLYNDDIASIDYPSGNGGSLNQSVIERAKYFIDDGLLANELAAPGAATDGTPDDLIVASLPKGRAVAFGNLVKDSRDELCVRGATAHGGEPFLRALVRPNVEVVGRRSRPTRTTSWTS